MYLELLAPAKNAQIGIAAIDCGADAVYIAGPSFGARQAAGNSVEDIASLCAHASRFGARVFATVNTILYDDELPRAAELMAGLQDAGVSGFIIQDPAVASIARSSGITVPLHASTQCSIRTPERAAFLQGLGFSRLVLERELSLDAIKSIREAVSAELEFFVHGALCVCYSGQCYLSEYLTGRSANRGACSQPCRSFYDLVDSSGRTLVKNKALLSLKDYSLIDRLGDLARSGVCSFKIEGRLKNLSYVENVVSAYSAALDKLVECSSGEYCRASFGRSVRSFAPNLKKTFNRDYTELFISGRRTAGWSSMDIPKGAGEYVGTVKSVRREGRREMVLTVSPLDSSVVFTNGDGFAALSPNGLAGFRGDVCRGTEIRAEAVEGAVPGARLYRTFDAVFGKQLEKIPVREIRVALDISFEGSGMLVRAVSEDGRECLLRRECPPEQARDRSRMESVIRSQLSKRSAGFLFEAVSVDCPGEMPFLAASFLNDIRREAAELLSRMPCRTVPLLNAGPSAAAGFDREEATYKDNVANRLAGSILSGCGAKSVEQAYEVSHRSGIELMRTKYCIRYETGICPKYHRVQDSGPLYLVNNGRRLALRFDCAACEMTVCEA